MREGNAETMGDANPGPWVLQSSHWCRLSRVKSAYQLATKVPLKSPGSIARDAGPTYNTVMQALLPALPIDPNFKDGLRIPWGLILPFSTVRTEASLRARALILLPTAQHLQPNTEAAVVKLTVTER